MLIRQFPLNTYLKTPLIPIGMCPNNTLIQKKENPMTYSLNLRELAEANNETSNEPAITLGIMNQDNNIIKQSNSTPITLEDIKENIKNFALNMYSTEELQKLYPEPNRSQIRADVLDSYNEGIKNRNTK